MHLQSSCLGRQTLISSDTSRTMVKDINYQIGQDRQQRAGDDLRRLEHFGFKIFSQSDEDGIIEEIFNRIGTTSRIFVEFGAETGDENNTRYLLEQGWTGLWMEALGQYADAIRSGQKRRIESGQLKFIETAVTAENINDLILSAGIKGEIDFLSIDIDGNDYHVFEAIDVIQPRVICLEHNHCCPPPIDWIMPYNPNHRWVSGSPEYGASIVALEKLAHSKGFILIGCGLYSANGFYVRADLVDEQKFSAPFSASRFFNPLDYQKIISFPKIDDSKEKVTPETFEILETTVLSTELAQVNPLEKCEQKVQRLRKRITRLETELKDSRAEIAAMKTSKFWKLRSNWFQLKRILRLSNKDS